jgi:hypothetical protein
MSIVERRDKDVPPFNRILVACNKYAYHAAALSVPRQNGKSWDARSRCFYGSSPRARRSCTPASTATRRTRCSATCRTSSSLNGGTKTSHHSTDRSRPLSWTEPALRSTPAAGGGTSAARQWHTSRRSSLPISRVPAPVRLRSQCARTERPSLRQLHNAVQRIAEQLCRVVDELGTRSLPSALWDSTHLTHPNVIRPCHAGHGRSDLKIKG